MTPVDPAANTNNPAPVLLEVQDLKMHFPLYKSGLFRAQTTYLKAVDGISFNLREGETLALVGESGCGKTTAGRCIVRAYKPNGGRILYRESALPDQDQPKVTDLVQIDGSELRRYRKEIRMVFQDPYSSLNPRMTVLDIVGDPLKVHRVAHGKALEERVANLLTKVGLRPEYMRRYPHSFSGGQRQRIAIARALALEPRLVVADEAVSALDVSVQAQTLNLLKDLQAEFKLTYLFISHDLSVVRYMADRIAVMYAGKLVELAETETLFRRPLHPYTEALLSAVPKPDPRLRSQRIVLEGDVPDPMHPPSGCYFHPRCRYVHDRCKTEAPGLSTHGESGEHSAACHYADSLVLRGVQTLTEPTITKGNLS